MDSIERRRAQLRRDLRAHLGRLDRDQAARLAERRGLTPAQIRTAVKFARLAGEEGYLTVVEAMGRRDYYHPVERGFEREMQKRLDYWNKLRARRRQPA